MDAVRGLRARLLQDSLGWLSYWTQLWESKDFQDCTKGSVAFGLLEAFGMAYRYSGDEEKLRLFLGVPERQRVRLGRAACRYLAKADIPETAKALWARDDFDEGSQAQVEGVFFLRDEIDVVLAMVKALLFEVFEEKRHPQAFEEYAKALQMARRLDCVMRSRPELAMFAPGMRALGECIVTGVDSRQQWWLVHDAQAYMDRKEVETERWLADLVDRARSSRGQS